MLRLILDWFANHRGAAHNLAISENDRWYSEALLPSQFLPRYRGDRLSESWTHADGVIGDFVIGKNGEGDLSLTTTASKFVVTEAKMFSKLSSGVKNAGYYNHAARNVACMAEVIRRADIEPRAFGTVGFYVVAPKSRIDEGVFSAHMNSASVRETVERRVREYGDEEKEAWLENWFLPVLEVAKIQEISWEEIVEYVAGESSSDGGMIQDFYGKCLEYNQHVAKRYAS